MSERNKLEFDVIAQSITRVPTVMGVGYTYWVIIMSIAVECIAALHSVSALIVLPTISYVICRWLTRHDPFLLDIVFKKSQCETSRNLSYWGAKSYEAW